MIAPGQQFSVLQTGPCIEAGKRAGRASGPVSARMAMVIILFCCVFCVIAARLVNFGLSAPAVALASLERAHALGVASRPDFVDRNGMVLATDIPSYSLFAEPGRIQHVAEAVDLLAAALPEADPQMLAEKLMRDAEFVWIMRKLSPQRRNAIHDLGLPGIGFKREYKRYYPGGATASHIVGMVDIDNRGVAGMELAFEGSQWSELRDVGLTGAAAPFPVELALDLRVQHVVRDELLRAVERYSAKSAVGIIMDVRTGEVIASVSLPDFDPNERSADARARYNRASAAVFEMGSVFKIFTIAAALDADVVNLSDQFDAVRPIEVAGHTISDFHARKQWLSVPEIFIYSSNIGSAKLALAGGGELQRAFLHRAGLLNRAQTELPEIAAPLLPGRWDDLTTMTTSFGHGIAVSPLQTLVGAAALVNGGLLIDPTFYVRDADAAAQGARRLVSARSSATMRYLFRLNVTDGSGRLADMAGYMVGGKTGTAEMVENGVYVEDRLRNSFVAAFPMNNPQYALIVMLDEPQEVVEGEGASAGRNTAPVAGAIIRRAAPLLGVLPDAGPAMPEVETPPLLANLCADAARCRPAQMPVGDR